MRCVEVLQSAIEENLTNIHARRRAAVWLAVTALIMGGRCCLTALGRALPGSTTEKHRIKTVDRLLGNAALHGEIALFYSAIAELLLKNVKMPIIAVDWSGAGAHHEELSAKICSDGRALPLFSLVVAKNNLVRCNAHSELLRQLSSILPAHCKPIFITDAGFHYNWFNEVRRYNWHYIGRIRGNHYVEFDGSGRLMSLKQLHLRAGPTARDLGRALVSICHPRVERLVLASQPRKKGRKRLGRKGKCRRSSTDRASSKSAREPWVLATSLPDAAAKIVHAYSLRMQIEQSFRDRKNPRHGWSMRLTTTRSVERMAVLLLIASLAELSVQLEGRATVVSIGSAGFQANTTRKRRVLSFLFLGCRACRTGVVHTVSQLRAALRTLVRTISFNSKRFADNLTRPHRDRPSARAGRPHPSLAF